jgi:serine/threonine-protein phosphatase 4 regulatory subunit 1
MVDFYQKFLKDNSKNVRLSAFENLGQFIASLENLEINEDLIDAFIRMGENSHKDTVYHCAYNFPGVLLTLGPSSWGSLKKTFFKLSKSSDVRVKSTLAHSLHEIAKILGPEISESELIPLAKNYLKDGLSKLKYTNHNRRNKNGSFEKITSLPKST